MTWWNGIECLCEWVDIGVGQQRVTDNPDCPKHNPQTPDEGRTVDNLTRWAERVAQRFGADDEAAADLLGLIRAVVRSQVADEYPSCGCHVGHYSNCPQREINAWVRDRVSAAPFCACGGPRGHLWTCSESDPSRREVCFAQTGLLQQIHVTQWIGGTDGVPEHCAVCERRKPCGNCGRTPPQDGRCPWCCPGCGSTDGIHTDGSCVN